ncbi:MAG: ribosomal RNA small subunit methyltransferase A [Gemmatimonadetes bacterium]|nr:ribosomal RNA small subunit methyltransferase A [Gemmatimonadota bacterium]
MRPKKSLGQNFLVDAGIQRRIVAALEPAPDDEVLEVGPGTGALTRHLAGTVRRLVLVELDDGLAAALRQEFAGSGGVDVVHGDILEVDLSTLFPEPARVKVIGNIPYNITSRLLFRLLERRARPARAVVMVQREVADRLLAAPGEKAYGALSVGVRAVADVERVLHVGRGAFRPVPEVDSTVLRITPHRPPELSEREEADLRTLTRAAFGWRRKQLQKILRSAPAYGLAQAELDSLERATAIELGRRPETLSVEEFVRLARALRAAGCPRTRGGAGP